MILELAIREQNPWLARRSSTGMTLLCKRLSGVTDSTLEGTTNRNAAFGREKQTSDKPASDEPSSPRLLQFNPVSPAGSVVLL